MPGDLMCAYDYPVDAYDIENMTDDEGEITRDSVENWLSAHAGDFRSIEDFSGHVANKEFPWTNDDSEIIYFDCMFGNEDF